MKNIEQKQTIASKKVIYPGTFDPITIGHFDIIKSASKIFDKVIVAVAQDTNKKTLFSANQRVKMIQEALDSEEIENVIIKQFAGLLTDFVIKEETFIIVRGLRVVSDFEHELQMSYINKKMNPKIETVLLPATENSHYISSTFVKEIARLGGDISKFVAKNVELELKKCFGNLHRA